VKWQTRINSQCLFYWRLKMPPGKW